MKFVKFLKKRKKDVQLIERKSADELRASIEEKLARYTPSEPKVSTFDTLPLPTQPTTTIRDIRSRIVVSNPEAVRVNPDAVESVRSRGTDNAVCDDDEDMSNLIEVPGGDGCFELSWMAHRDEASDDTVERIRKETEHFWSRAQTEENTGK